MTFWTSNTLEPKRQFRWIVSIGNMPAGAIYYAKKVKKPAVDLKTTEHKYLNHTFKYPGAEIKWQPVDITLVDPVSPDASQNLAAILENSGYMIPGNYNHLTSISKANMCDSLGNVVIYQIGAGTDSTSITATTATTAGQGQQSFPAIESWTLKNPIISKIDFGGELDYTKSELVEVKLTLEYDWAELETTSPHNLNDSVLTSAFKNQNPKKRFVPRGD